ncbi:hypothetical protein BDV29DRAFT_186804 [Aspergillus leporis]|uniref:Uncharacterized protein n=1 Tax=Aspergillus leporis TaxID=41062 RepID=A0A5N5WHE9_9EURO|nr:hypothetical protein BDV29DRAFT_186804 [Aspergillus leporis]
MLSGEGKNPQAPVSVFFELEARSKSLQQAEHELCQKVGTLKVSCQSIEDRYCVRQSQPNPLNPPNLPNPPNQGYRISHPRRYPPNDPIGSRPGTKSTTPARGKRWELTGSIV